MLFENDRFHITVGSLKGRKDGPVYLVTNKSTEVVEYADSVLLHTRAWAIAMTQALDEQDREIANEREQPPVVLEANGDGRPN